MTVAEYKAWKAETESSCSQWVLDPIGAHNGTGYLFYKGNYATRGETGHYVMIMPDGSAELGVYNDAVPHIGEAEFRRSWDRKFDSPLAALTYFRDRGGFPVLLDLALRADLNGRSLS